MWTDANGDRESAPGELAPAARTLVSISLAVRREPRCDARANCQRERAPMTWRDAAGALHAGAVVDVYPYAR